MTYSANRLLGMYVEDDDYKALILVIVPICDVMF